MPLYAKAADIQTLPGEKLGSFLVTKSPLNNVWIVAIEIEPGSIADRCQVCIIMRTLLIFLEKLP